MLIKTLAGDKSKSGPEVSFSRNLCHETKTDGVYTLWNQRLGCAGGFKA